VRAAFEIDDPNAFACQLAGYAGQTLEALHLTYVGDMPVRPIQDLHIFPHLKMLAYRIGTSSARNLAN
jgi:hypothetical protein